MGKDIGFRFDGQRNYGQRIPKQKSNLIYFAYNQMPWRKQMVLFQEETVATKLYIDPGW